MLALEVGELEDDVLDLGERDADGLEEDVEGLRVDRRRLALVAVPRGAPFNGSPQLLSPTSSIDDGGGTLAEAKVDLEGADVEVVEEDAESGRRRRRAQAPQLHLQMAQQSASIHYHHQSISSRFHRE